MTRLGKFLVLGNAAFSIGMMAWAIALFANRIDWSGGPTGKGSDGEINQRRERIDDMRKAFFPAEVAWRDNRAGILTLEAQRPGDRDFFAKELVHLRDGADDASPARKVEFEKGVPALDPMNKNRPRMTPVNGLRSLARHETELKQERIKLVEQIERFNKAVLDDTRLTNLLAGTPTMKGLRQRIVEERVKLAELLKEQEVVRPQLINAFVESQLILKRADGLKARIRELEGVGEAAQR